MQRRGDDIKSGTRTSRALTAALVISTALGFSATLSQRPAFAQTQTSFNVPAGPLNRALATFGRQAGLQVTYLASLGSGKSSAGFSGSATAERALAKILAGSGLVYSFSDATTVSISAGGDGAAADGSTVLQPIEVVGNSPSADNATVTAKYSSSATKLDTPLIKTARSVSVITKKEIDQRAVQNALEAVSYTAGVTIAPSGFDPRFDEFHIRGFDATTAGDYKDGLRQPYLNFSMFRTEPYSLDRYEVVKGPVSVLYGAGTPAGILNKVSKFADGEQIREVEGLYGTRDRGQFAFDVGDTVPNNDDLSYRLVGLVRKGDTNFDIADDAYFLQPSFTWKPSDQTKITVYGLAQKTETDGSVNAITDENGVVHNLRAGDPEYDYQKTQQQQVGYQVEHEFSDVLTFRQNLRFSHLDMDARYLEVASWTGTVAHRYPYAFHENMNVFQADTQLQWTFDTGPIEHKLLTGIDYTYGKSTFAYGYGNYDDPDPAFDLDIADPHYGISGATPAIDNYSNTETLQQTGIYALDQIKLDRWNFTLGGRNTWVEQTDGGYTNDPDAGYATIGDSLAKHAFNVQAGALYAFDNGISPFASYATSFNPVTNRSTTGNVLDPTEGQQYELGVKYQPPGTDVMLSAVAYNLVEKNEPTVVDADLGTYRSLGEVTNKGIELEGRANVVDGLDLIANYTYTHSRITAGDDKGNQTAVTPPNTASLWANYTFSEASSLSGLSTGAGVRYASSNYSDTDNTVKNASTVYFDAAVSYNFGAIDKKYNGLLASFNIRNIANHRDTVCNEGTCYLAQGRNVTASLKYRW